MKIEIAKKDWNGYKLHEFLQFELTNNDEMDEFHALIYVRLIWITNRSGWSDSINVPTDYTAKQSRCHPKTYRKKMKDLETFGMITILKKSMNQYTSAEVTLKTDHLKNTMVALYLLNKKPSMPGNLEGKANGSPVASAWEPGGQGKVPHIKRKGADATLSENTEVKRETETAHAVPPAKETEPDIPRTINPRV